MVILETICMIVLYTCLVIAILALTILIIIAAINLGKVLKELDDK